MEEYFNFQRYVPMLAVYQPVEPTMVIRDIGAQSKWFEREFFISIVPRAEGNVIGRPFTTTFGEYLDPRTKEVHVQWNFQNRFEGM